MRTMLIRLSEASDASFAEQIAAQIRLGVARGEVVRGEKLPSARDLAGSLGVNMHTVLRAYDSLREAGVIDLRRGRGAVVVGGDAPAVRTLLDSVADLVSDARRLGISASDLSILVRGMG
jgi:GntR family transcriptional regulator